MSRKRTFPTKLYATAGKYEVNGSLREDTFAQIYESVLRGGAFQSLAPRVQMLYVYTRMQEVGKRKPNRELKNTPVEELVKSEDCFFFPLNVAAQYTNRYNSKPSSLYKDMRTLEKYGFIDIVVSGKNTRTKSVYRYSDRWKQYGKADTTANPTTADKTDLT